MVAQAADLSSPLSQVHIHQLGGAVDRGRKDASAFQHRESPFVLNIIGFWTEPSTAQSNIDWVRQTWSSVQPYSSKAYYINFLGAESPGQVRVAYGASYERLVGLKKKYDPSNMFRYNQNIKPN